MRTPPLQPRGAVSFRSLRALAVAAIVLLGGATGCGSRTADGARSDADGAATDGARSDARCTSISRAYVYGLTSPVYHYMPGVADPDRFAIRVGGEPVPPLDPNADLARQYEVELCAGQAVVDVAHAVSGAAIGHAEWTVTPVQFPELEEERKGLMAERILFATGGPGDYRTQVITPRWDAPPAGHWRFHVLNGLPGETISARLVAFDYATNRVVEETSNPFQAPIVTALAARDSAIAEVPFPPWTGLGAVPNLVAVEYWSSGTPLKKHWLPINLPNQDSPTRISSAPDGTIFTLMVDPEMNGSLFAYFFSCRDPLFAQHTTCP